MPVSASEHLKLMCPSVFQFMALGSAEWLRMIVGDISLSRTVTEPVPVLPDGRSQSRSE